jgi:hypothetical protein
VSLIRQQACVFLPRIADCRQAVPPESRIVKIGQAPASAHGLRQRSAAATR